MSEEKIMELEGWSREEYEEYLDALFIQENEFDQHMDEDDRPSGAADAFVEGYYLFILE